MRTIICDRCGKCVKQALQIRANIIVANEKSHMFEPWSDGKINGDYCQDCIDDISEFISGHRPTEEEKRL